MSERRVFGDAVAHSLGLHNAPMLATRTLRASSIAATRISCGPKQLSMTPQIPPEDSFIVAQYLTRLPYHELWSGGRPLLTQGYATNAMRSAQPFSGVDGDIMRSGLQRFCPVGCK